MSGPHYIADDMGESRDYHGMSPFGDPWTWVDPLIDATVAEIEQYLGKRAAFNRYLSERGDDVAAGS